MTLAQAIIGEVVSPKERGRFQGWFGANFALASTLGPVIGGILSQHLGWRSVFWINVPFGEIGFPTTTSQNGRVVSTHSFSLPSFRTCRLSSRKDLNPHSPTFSIAHRVRRKHQPLPSSRVIESAVKIAAQFRLLARHAL